MKHIFAYIINMDKQNPEIKKKSSAGKESNNSDSFFHRFFSFLFMDSSPEKEKNRLLKDIAKQLKTQHYKFYKPKVEEALPGMAKFFYAIYRVLGPAQIFFKNAETSGVLKTIIIDKSFTDKQKELLKSFEEEEIRKRFDEVSAKELASELKNKLSLFYSAFDTAKINEIDITYNLLLIFLHFLNFDYYFLLKKFDSGFIENDFLYKPHFDTINGEYITEDLKDFLEILPLLEKDSNWDNLFNILKEYKGTDIIGRTDWNKIVKGLIPVRNSNIFELIIKHTDKDPFYKVKFFKPNEKIVENYLSKIKTQTEITIQKILKEKQSNKINEFLNEIYGTTAISRLANYTDKANIAFSKRMLGGFIYIAPLNYLKAFLLDYLKKDIKDITELLLIRGKWSTALMSQQLSGSFHSLKQISDDLIAFDGSLSEEEEKGIALINALKRSGKDKNSMIALQKLLKTINESALNLINQSSIHFISMGKSFKNLIDDYDKKPHELILNWKEINNTDNRQIRSRMLDVYKKIYYFIQLLHFYIKKTK